MKKYSQKELDDALHLILSTINKCDKMQQKFLEGTAQHSLLKNRIKALCIIKALLEKEYDISHYTRSDLENALPPVNSIISKTEKAQSKYEEGTTQFKRFIPMINAMYISKLLIEEEIVKMGSR